MRARGRAYGCCDVQPALARTGRCKLKHVRSAVWIPYRSCAETTLRAANRGQMRPQNMASEGRLEHRRRDGEAKESGAGPFCRAEDPVSYDGAVDEGAQHRRMRAEEVVEG